jgi:peptidoglycan/xylan/chitin deacetylase (PgdA/CDA1 family)
MVQLPIAAIRRNEVCLTFDDGPDPVVTPQVLDILDATTHAQVFSVSASARRSIRT